MMGSLNKKQKKVLIRIIAAAVLLLAVNLLPLPFWLHCVLFAIS